MLTRPKIPLPPPSAPLPPPSPAAVSIPATSPGQTLLTPPPAQGVPRHEAEQTLAAITRRRRHAYDRIYDFDPITPSAAPSPDDPAIVRVLYALRDELITLRSKRTLTDSSERLDALISSNLNSMADIITTVTKDAAILSDDLQSSLQSSITFAQRQVEHADHIRLDAQKAGADEVPTTEEILARMQQQQQEQPADDETP